MSIGTLIVLTGCSADTVPENVVKPQRTYEQDLKKADVNLNENIEENTILDEYEKAVSEVEALRNKNLKEAYSKVVKLEEKYPDDKNVNVLLEEIEEDYICSFVEKMNEYISNNQYIEAIEIYNSEKKLLLKSEEASEIYEDAIEKYCNNAIEESDKIFYEEGAEAACKNIVKYKDSAVDCTALEERIELYKSYKPIKMSELETFYFEGNESYVYSWGIDEKDNLGNNNYEGYRYCHRQPAFRGGAGGNGREQQDRCLDRSRSRSGVLRRYTKLYGNRQRR